MSGGFRALIKLGSGRAHYNGGFIETMGGLFDVKNVNVDMVLSALATCFTRSIVETLNPASLEVLVELYEDLDALLDGRLDEIEQLHVRIKIGSDSRDYVERALERCPFYNMLKSRIKVLEVT